MERDFGRLPCLQRRGKTGDVFRFDRDDFCLRPQSFDRERNAGDQTAAANRNNHSIDDLDLLDDLDSHRSLAGDDRGIVIAIDVSETFFGGELMGMRFRFGKIFSVQNDVGAECLAITYFNERRVFRHHDRGRNAEQFSLISERLRVITGRSGDDAAFLLIGGQLRECVARAAFLKTSGPLCVVELAENFHARDLA